MKGIKLLVVDDEVMVRSFIKMVVTKEKLPVSMLYEADNGSDAVLLVKKLKPHLVFMDIRIPDIDGIRAAEKILADNQRVSIVIISAYGEFEYARAAFRAGISDYLLKPVRPVDIAESVRRAAALEVVNTEQAEGDKKPELIRLMEEYINNNLDSQLYLKDMAHAVFMSPFHLSRTFKRITGQSIIGFIHEQRLAKAEELLLNTALSITEIAGKVGFNDTAYFATCFKNKIGVSPTQRRKAQNILIKQQDIKNDYFMYTLTTKF